MRRLGALLAPRWRALTGSASAAAAALGLLACLCTLLAVVGPRAGAQLRTEAWRHFVAGSLLADKTVVGTVDYSDLSGPAGLSAGHVQATMDLLSLHLQTLPLARPAADWSSVTTPPLAATVTGPARLGPLPPKLELSFRNTLAENVRVVAGKLPAGGPGTASTAILQGAVTPPVARAFGLAIGSVVSLPGTEIEVRVTAIVSQKDPASTFWTTDPAVAAPAFVQIGADEGYWLGGIFIAGGDLPALLGRVNPAVTEVTFTFPLALGQLTAAQALALRPVLLGALTTAGSLTGVQQQPILVELSSGAVQLITDFAAEAAAIGNVLDLLSVSLAVLAASVVLLVGWLLAEQRRPEFAVLRARGASRRQLALLVLAVGAVTALPGAAAGAAIAVALTPSSPDPLAWWLAGLEAVAALAGPVAVTVRTHRGYAAVVRPDVPPARLSAVRRLVVEAGLVLAAAGGLVVLRDQGGGASGDVYASAAPILLAVGVAVIVLRVYPLLVRGVLRLTGQRAGPSAFLGLVRAARVPAGAALPAFAMVLALAVVSFAGMVRGSVLTGEETASWQQLGADAVITGTGPVTAALQRAVAAVPGVRHIAPVGIGNGYLSSVSGFNVLLVTPKQYAALIAASPLPRPPAEFTASGAGAAVGGHGSAGPVPALASPGLAAQLGRGPVGVLVDGEPVTVRVVGLAASDSAVDAIGGGLGYLVLDREVAGAAAAVPDALLVVGPSMNQQALRTAVRRPGTTPTVVFRSRLLAGLEDAPLQDGAYVALGLGAGAAGCCGLLVLLLSLLLSASTREVALARMSTMGLSTGQGRVLGLVELAPQLVGVLAGGLACAVALVPLTGPGLSLSVFTGSGAGVPVRVEPAWLVVAGLGLVVLAVVTLTAQTALAGRNAARSLRMGE